MRAFCLSAASPAKVQGADSPECISLDQPGHIDLVVGFVCQHSWLLVFPTSQNGTLPGTFAEIPSLTFVVAFEIADSAEWKAIVDSGSVKVLDSEVANTTRKERPDRVINSRMVRRLKPQEGTFQKPKAKSRWCVLGHQDPDALPTCSPTHPLHRQRAS